MAKSTLNIFSYNKNLKNQPITRDQIKEKLFPGQEDSPELNEKIDLAYKSSVINSLNKDKLAEIISDSTILGIKQPLSQKSKYVESAYAKETYKAITPFFNYLTNIDDHLRKKQTSDKLISNAFELVDGVNYSMQSSKSNSSTKTLNNTMSNFEKAHSFYAYDTEVYGGRGPTGVDEIDSFQELSFKKFNKTANGIEEDVKSRFETLIGINPNSTQYREYEQMIKDFEAKGFQGNEKYKVIGERLALLGHPETRINMDAGYGIVTTENLVDRETRGLITADNMKVGLKRAAKIYKKQDIERASNGLMMWQDNLFNMANVISNPSTMSVGYNTVNYDNPKINQVLASIFTNAAPDEKKRITHILGLKNDQVPSFTPATNMHLDVLDLARKASGIAGRSALYDTPEQLKTAKATGTLLQQESFGRAFFSHLYGTSAHTAGQDVEILANLASSAIGNNNGTPYSFAQKMIGIINSEQDVLQGTVKRDSLLVAKKTLNFNDYSRYGALNFTLNPIDNTIETFNGYSISKDGSSIKKNNFGAPTGIKKNVMYRQGFIGKLDMNEDWVNEMQKTNPDLAAGELWASVLNPVLDKNQVGDNTIPNQPLVYLFNSQQQLEGAISSNFVNVGNYNNGNLMPLDSTSQEIINKYFTPLTVQDGHPNPVETASPNLLEDLITNGTTQLLNDPAARTVRGYEYSKVQSFLNMKDLMSSKGVVDTKEQRMALSLATAKKVSQGQDLKINMMDIKSILGYKDKSTDSQIILPGTLNNHINAWEYNSSLENVYRQVMNKLNARKDLSPEAKQMYFENYMQNIMNGAENEFGSTQETLRLNQDELNYFEVNLPGYFNNPNKYAEPTQVNDVLKIKLSPDGLNPLVNHLIDYRQGDDRIKNNPNTKEEYAVNELNRLVEALKNTPATQEQMANFNFQTSEGNALGSTEMFEQLIGHLKSERDKDPAWGYVEDRTRQNVLTPYEHAPKLTTDFINKYMNIADESNPKVNIGSKIDTNDLIDKIFKPVIKDEKGHVLVNTNDMTTFAQRVYGYNGETAGIYKNVLDTSMADYQKMLNDLFTAVSNHGANIVQNEKERTIDMIYNGQTFNLNKYLPIMNFEDGSLNFKLGQQKFSAHMQYDVSKAISGTGFVSSQVTIKSNMAKAYDFTYLNAQMNNAETRGENPIMSAIFTLMNSASEMRRNSTIGKSTTKDMYSFQKIGMEDIFKALPYKINEIKQYAAEGKFVQNDISKIIEKHADLLKKGTMNNEVREITAKDLKTLAEIVVGPNRIDMVGKITNIINNNVKDTDFTTNEMFIGSFDTRAFSEFDNNSRPNAQGSLNTRIYSKDEIEKEIKTSKSSALKDITVGNKLMTTREAASTQRTISGLGQTVSGVELNNVKVSESSFKHILSDEIKKRRASGLLSDKEKKAFDMLSQLNLGEQGKIMEGYTFQALFHGSEKQSIKIKKQIDNDLITNNEIMRKRIENAMPVIDIAKNGDVVFTLGKKQIVRRNDPLLSLTGFGGVEDVISAKENYGAFSYGYAAKNTEIFIDDKFISNFLTQHKEEILDNGKKINYKKANELLSKNFDALYQVENMFLNGYGKITTEGSEKAMAAGALAGLGTIDEDINSILKLIGKDDLIGKIIDEKHLDTVIDNIIAPKLKLSDRQNISKSELKQKILAEKYMPSKVLGSIDVFNNSHVIGLDDIGKHKSAGLAVRETVRNVLYDYKTNKNLNDVDAANETVKALKDSGAFNNIGFNVNGSGVITVNSNKDSSININEMTELRKKYQDKNKITHKFEDGSEVTLRRDRDFTATAHDDRSLSAENTQVKELKDRIKRTEKLKDNYEVGSDDYNKLQEQINYMKKQVIGGSKKDKEVKLNTRALTNLSLKEYDQDELQKIRDNIGNEFENIYGHMYDSNGNLLPRYKDRKINSGLLNNLNKAFQDKYKKTSGVISNGIEASKFNNDRNMSPDKEDVLHEKGFTKSHVDEIIPTYGDDNSFLNDNRFIDENNPNRLFGRNLILETSTGDKIAIPELKHSYIGNKEVSHNALSSFNSLARAEQRYQDGINGQLAKNETLNDLKERVSSAASNMKDAIDKAVRSTFKDREHIDLSKGAFYGKANTSAFIPGKDFEESMYPLFKKSEFMGKTLDKWFKDGAYIPVQYAGPEHFSDYLENFKEYGMKSKNDMMDYLETHGTMDLTSRSPDIMTNSTRTAVTYLNRNLSKQVQVLHTLELGSNQDQDGDGRSTAEIVYGDNKETYATWQIKKNKGISTSDEDKFFKDMETAMHYQATTTDVKLHNMMAEKDTGTIDKDRKMELEEAGTVFEKASMNGRTVTADSFRNYTGSERLSAIKEFTPLEDKAAKYYEDRRTSDSKVYSDLDDKEKFTEVQNYIQTLDGKEVQKNKVLLTKMEQIAMSDQGSMSKTGKEAVGYVNIPLHGLRKVAEKYGMNNEDRNLFQSIANIIEEGNISRKNTIATGLSLTTQIVESANNLTFGGERGRKGAQQLIDILDKPEVTDMFVKNFRNFNAAPKLDNLNNDELIDRAHTTIKRLADVFDENSSAKSYYKASIASSQFNRGTASEIGDALEESISNRNFKINSDAYDGLKKKIMTGLSDEIKEISHGIQSSGLAKMALGLAASVMVAGYVGGNPTTPADNQAEQLDNSYDSLQDKDLSIQNLPQGSQQQGYVININAQSSRGKDHAIQAIQKAMQSTAPTNVNVSMKVTDKSSIIDNRFIDNLLSGAL